MFFIKMVQLSLNLQLVGRDLNDETEIKDERCI